MSRALPDATAIMRLIFICLFSLAIGMGIVDAAIATGGSVSTIVVNGTNYTLHRFTSSGTLTVNTVVNASVLIVAAGGGVGGGVYGTCNQAGGGGGQVLYNANLALTTGAKTVTVGAGGTHGGDGINGGKGGNSIFMSLNANGGGGGNGHCTGGTSGSGYSGGTATGLDGSGGGGGNSHAGANGALDQAGRGGDGTASSITGSVVYYGGGGAGISRTTSTEINGLGGGTGSYGGGGDVWRAGGPGIVIIRYPTPVVPAPNVTVFGGASSTNFSTVSDLSNVTNLTLERPGKGRIKFPTAHSINAVGQDYDAYVKIDNGFISVDSAALDPTFNSSAQLTINASGVYSKSGVPGVKHYSGFATDMNTILQNGVDCIAPACTIVSWDPASKQLVLNVSGFSGYAIYDNGTQVAWGSNGTIGINITSTNQIAVYTSSAKNNSAFSFVPVTPPAAGSITLTSNESSNVTNGDIGFLVENQGNVNVSIDVTSNKQASAFIGGSAPLFQAFGAENKSNSCPGINATAQDLGASAITVCPSLAFADSQDTIWAYVLVKIDSDSPPQTSTATLTFTSTQV